MSGCFACYVTATPQLLHYVNKFLLAYFKRVNFRQYIFCSGERYLVAATLVQRINVKLKLNSSRCNRGTTYARTPFSQLFLVVTLDVCPVQQA